MVSVEGDDGGIIGENQIKDRVAHLVVHGDNLLVDEQVADRVAYGAVTLHDGNCEFRHVVNP